MIPLRNALLLTSVLLTAALFGFFYAWVCSTMWGLDTAPPQVAIAAMQAMNASVRNAVFAPAFFGTAPVLLLTAAVLAATGAGRAALGFAVAGVLALAGVLATMLVNVPMNEALAITAIPADPDAAGAIWAAYSPRWQWWNAARTMLCAGAVIAVFVGLMALPKPAAR